MGGGQAQVRWAPVGAAIERPTSPPASHRQSNPLGWSSCFPRADGYAPAPSTDRPHPPETSVPIPWFDPIAPGMPPGEGPFFLPLLPPRNQVSTPDLFNTVAFAGFHATLP